MCEGGVVAIIGYFKTFCANFFSSLIVKVIKTDLAVVAEWVNMSINHQPMLKVEDSNSGASILKFGLFHFLKWMCLDKNNNLGILVVLLVLTD